MKEQTLFIRSGGPIEIIGDPPPELELDLLGTAQRRRASRIVPVHRGKRFLFFLLRFIFGERGITAEWTREWQGPWVAVLFATGETFTSESRQACLRWEYKRLNQILSNL